MSNAGINVTPGFPEPQILDRGYLEGLRGSLQPLALEPDSDRTASSIPELRDYLDFYHLEPASFPGARHYMGCASLGDYRIALHYWLRENAIGTALVSHGYYDHVGLYGHLFRYLLSRGWNLVAYDLPGHGLSDGEQVTIRSFDHYVEVFADLVNITGRKLPGPLIAVGQSTGGAITLKYVLEHGGDEFAKVALLAPLIHPRAWGVNRLMYALLHRFRHSIGREFLVNSGDAEFVEFVTRRDPLQARFVPMEWIGAMKMWTEEFAAMPPCDYPVAIVQGDRDTTLDWRYNLRVLGKKLPSAKITTIAGARHHMVNETPELRARIFAAMEIPESG